MKPSKAEAERLAKRYTEIAGRAVNPNEVEDSLEDFDEVKAGKEEAAKFRTEIWDKQTPINGVPAADVLAARKDIPEDATIYLVYEGSRVFMFQPFDPDKEGFTKMTPAVARTKADKHVENLVKPKVLARMEQHVYGKLNVDPDTARIAREKREQDEEVERRVQERLERLDSEVRQSVRRDEAERIIREARA